MVLIKENDEHYDVIDQNCCIHQYKKNDINELHLFIDFLIDAYNRAEDKQSQWFDKYWELKKKMNKISDVVDE